VHDTDRHHVSPGDPRLLRFDALIPCPYEPLQLALVANGEGETVLRLARVRQRQRDPADILLISHDPPPAVIPTRRTWRFLSVSRLCGRHEGHAVGPIDA